MIFHRFKLLLICSVFLSVPCCNNSHFQPDIPSSEQDLQLKNSCLSADGYGKSINDARINARKELSNIIIIQIKSSWIEHFGSKNNEIFHEVMNNINEKSETLLKGVLCYPYKKIDNEYQCKAVLSQQAYNDTIRYLEGKVFVNLDNRSRIKLNDILAYVEYLDAILTTTTKCSAFNKDLLNRVRQVREKIYIRLTHGIVTIKPMPKDAYITIDNKDYKPFTPIFIKPGEYALCISKNGYHTKKARFYISKGDKKDYFVTLIPSGLTIFVSLAQTNNQLRKEIETILIKNGLSVSKSPLSGNAFRVEFSHQKNKIENYTQHVVKLSIKAYKRNKITCVHTEEIKYFKDSAILKKQNELLETAINNLFSKIDWNNFYSNQKFNYNALF